MTTFTDTDQAQIAHVGLVLIGLLLLGVGVVQFSQGDYTHHIQQVSSSQVPSDGPHYEFDDLSSDGRTVVQRAREAPDGAVTVRTSNRIPELRYGDASPRAYYVVSDEQYYRLTTGDSGFLTGVDELVASVFIVVGGLSIVVGGRDYYQYRISDV